MGRRRRGTQATDQAPIYARCSGRIDLSESGLFYVLAMLWRGSFCSRCCSSIFYFRELHLKKCLGFQCFAAVEEVRGIFLFRFCGEVRGDISFFQLVFAAIIAGDEN